MVFSCNFNFHTTWILIYLPILSFLLLHSSIQSCWWCTFLSGAFSFLHPFDAQYRVYYVCICNFISIYSINQNTEDSYVKILHSHAIKSLVFMNLASILKEFYIRFVWGFFSKFVDVGEAMNDVWLYTFMTICSVAPNTWNSYVKILHSHVDKSLVFMYLASILKEFYIRFVWGILS